MSITNLGIDGLEDVEQIGTGGSSRVYRARQVDLDRVVAVKVLNPGGDQGVAKRFDRERKAMGRLSLNEGIVPVYSSGVTAHGEPFLVMPYYPNGSLQDQIDAGPLEWQTAVGYVDVAAETIADAHDQGIVHLDLKPANILLTNTGAPRIADFGIARLTTSSATAGTTAGTAFTPAYSAPETFLDGETGPPSDVYGLGATLWALLVGHPPFLTPGDDSNLMAVIGRVVNNQVGDLRHIAPEPICAVVEQAMAKRPEDRYQSAREFSLDLKAASAATSPDFAPVADDTKSTTLFPAVGGAAAAAAPGLTPDAVETTSSAAMGLERPPFQAPDDAATTVAGGRTLLQETAQALPKPVGGQPNVAPAPFIDLDRFRVGPILLGALAFALIVGVAAFALFRSPDSTTADLGDPLEDPAGPTSSIEPSASGGSTSSTEDEPTSSSSASTATTTGTDAAENVNTTATTESATTESTEASSTTDGSSTTSESTTTTEDTTTTTESTTSSSTTETTTSTTEVTTSSSSTPTTVVAPDSPEGLTATASADETEIALDWSAPSDGPRPEGYQVRRNGVTIRDDLALTAFVDRDVEPGTYTYTVRAIGEDGELSPPSNSATITVGPLDITAFTVTRQPTSVLVSFSANKCASYRIRAISDGVDDPDPVTGPAAGCVDSDSLRINGLDADTDYTVTLVINAPGEVAVSRQQQAPAP